MKRAATERKRQLIIVARARTENYSPDEDDTSDALLCTRSKGSDSAVCKAGDEGEVNGIATNGPTRKREKRKSCEEGREEKGVPILAFPPCSSAPGR